MGPTGGYLTDQMQVMQSTPFREVAEERMDLLVTFPLGVKKTRSGRIMPIVHIPKRKELVERLNAKDPAASYMMRLTCMAAAQFVDYVTPGNTDLFSSVELAWDDLMAAKFPDFSLKGRNRRSTSPVAAALSEGALQEEQHVETNVAATRKEPGAEKKEKLAPAKKKAPVTQQVPVAADWGTEDDEDELEAVERELAATEAALEAKKAGVLERKKALAERGERRRQAEAGATAGSTASAEPVGGTFEFTFANAIENGVPRDPLTAKQILMRLNLLATLIGSLATSADNEKGRALHVYNKKMMMSETPRDVQSPVFDGTSFGRPLSLDDVLGGETAVKKPRIESEAGSMFGFELGLNEADDQGNITVHNTSRVAKLGVVLKVYVRSKIGDATVGWQLLGVVHDTFTGDFTKTANDVRAAMVEVERTAVAGLYKGWGTRLRAKPAGWVMPEFQLDVEHPSAKMVHAAAEYYFVILFANVLWHLECIGAKTVQEKDMRIKRRVARVAQMIAHMMPNTVDQVDLQHMSMFDERAAIHDRDLVRYNAATAVIPVAPVVVQRGE